MKQEAYKTISISIILPVFHETGIINATLGRLLELRQDDQVEIIVVDGDPRGSTIKAIRDPRVVTAISEKGRARQMNYGASLSSGDVLIFLHADTFLPVNALSLVRTAIYERKCVAGAFSLGLNSTKRIFRIIEKCVSFRTRLTRVPFGDQAIFIRRNYFLTIGGYREIPLMEDIDFMRRIKKRDGQICIISEKVLASVRRWEKEGVFYATIRNWSLQAAYVLGVSPEKLARWYKF